MKLNAMQLTKLDCAALFVISDKLAALDSAAGQWQPRYLFVSGGVTNGRIRRLIALGYLELSRRDQIRLTAKARGFAEQAELNRGQHGQ